MVGEPAKMRTTPDGAELECWMKTSNADWPAPEGPVDMGMTIEPLLFALVKVPSGVTKEKLESVPLASLRLKLPVTIAGLLLSASASAPEKAKVSAGLACA